MSKEKQELMARISNLTQMAKIVKPSEVEFIRTDSRVASVLDSISFKLLQKINSTIEQSGGSRQEVFSNVGELVTDFDKVGDFMDSMFERADILMDTIKGSKAKIHREFEYVEQKNQKPQDLFKVKVDNTSWVPPIKYKPNQKKPLARIQQLSEEMKNHIQETVENQYEHPYEYEIQTIEYPQPMFEILNQIKYLPVKDCSPIMVDSLELLQHVSKELLNIEIIAVDLEHHDYRSYQGITCLIQISTPHHDYIIDSIKLRDSIHLLNESFTNSKIVKVFHGADMDIQWLQRDFGVYVVNMFDTFHASHVLGLEKHSLSHLLEVYCGLTVDKKHQKSDWRLRPIPNDMLQYAQTDTHYLLYIYEQMKNQLLVKGVEPLKEVLERSSQVCLKKYEIPKYDADGILDKSGGWKSIARKSMDILNDENIVVLRELHGWRDHVARIEDESPRYVLPRFVLVTLARVEPTTSEDVLATCVPTPPLLRKYSHEIADIISNTVNSFRLERKIHELKNSYALDNELGQDVVLNSTKEFNRTKTEFRHKIAISITNKSGLFSPSFVDGKSIAALTWRLQKVEAPAQVPVASLQLSKFLTVRDSLVGIKRKREETDESTTPSADDLAAKKPKVHQPKLYNSHENGKKRSIMESDSLRELHPKGKKQKRGEIAVNLEMPTPIIASSSKKQMLDFKSFDYANAQLELKTEEPRLQFNPLKTKPSESAVF